MKRFAIIILSLTLFICNTFAEEVDYSSMSMRDALVLMDRRDIDPETYLQSVYDSQIEKLRTLSDISVFVTYGASYEVVQERDLMKYAPILGMESSENKDNLEDLSFEDLSDLRDQILKEMMSRDDWQEVTVPAGTYKVGEAIPAGRWIITCAPPNYCYVTVGSVLEENGKEIVYGSSGYYHIALAGVNSGISSRGYPSYVDLDLKEGMYIFIENAYVTFTPYAGQNDFGFSFN